MAFSENAKQYLSKSAALFASLLFLALLINNNLHPATAAPAGNTYYVAPNGNDNHAGTINKPWRTIDFATSNPILKPGDVVYVRGGVYNEYIKTEVSGAPANPIIFRNYPGETPVITGNGSWRWHVLDQSHIHIQGFTFRNFGKGGIQLRTRDANMTDITISHCTFENQSQVSNDGAKTVHVTTTVSNQQLTNVTIRDNQFVNIDSGDHPSLQIAGHASSVRVLNNTFINTSSITIGVAGRPDTGQPERILIKGNNISGHGSPGKHSAGIYLDGAGEEIVVEGNVVHSGQQGIKVDIEPAASSLVTRYAIIRHNTLYNNSQINLKLGVGSVSSNCSNVGNLERSVAVHNTLFTELFDVTNIRFSCGRNLRWKNNLLAYAHPDLGFQYKFGNDTINANSWVVDHNFFYEPSGDKSYRWDLTTYNSFSQYRTATGRDPNSMKGSAAFVNLNQRNFNLRPESDAVDAGGPLTTTRSGGSGAVIPVEEAWYFSDGMGLQTGDAIRVGGQLVTITGVHYGRHELTVDRSISWSAGAPVSYDFENAAPDNGAFELAPLLSLAAIPADRSIRLQWQTNVDLPPAAQWHIEFSGPSTQDNSPVVVNNASTRAYELNGLTNYRWYNITLSVRDGGEVLLSTQTAVMPTDIFTYLPHVSR